MALSNNSGDLFIAYTLEEPIMKQYLDNCLKNATFISNTWAESIVNAINFNVETKASTEINDASFISLYADEAENSFPKECFSMFVTHCNTKDIVTWLLGIVNLKGKTFEITVAIKNIFAAKYVKLKNVVFNILDGSNLMSGKKSRFPRRIGFYLDSRNHHLALCLTHLIKDLDTGELL